MNKKTKKDDVHEDIELIDTDTMDNEELENIEENSEAKIKKLRKELQESEKEKMQYLEDLQRAKAEFLNAKRRLEEERLTDKERAVTKQIEKLLPMCDSFHMAMANKEAWDAIDVTWRKGVESIYTQLQSILTSYGVEEVNPLGAVFNPQEHEAMTNVPVSNKDQHDTVVSVIQNGFVRTVGGKAQLIRPAGVIVGEYTE